MKKFLRSLGTFAPQTIDAIVATVQYAIQSGQTTELTTETLNVQVQLSQENPDEEVGVLVTDMGEEFHDTILGLTYNYQGEFFSSVGFQTADKPKPEPKLLPLTQLLGLVLSNSQQKG